jgi:hypothetical protein
MECQVLGFIECVRQIPGKESHSKTPQGQGAQISKNTVEDSGGTFVASGDDVAVFSLCISVNKGRKCSQQDSTQNKLDEGADRNDRVRGS